MGSRKREARLANIDLERDLELPSDDILLPAAVRFARDLLGASPTDTSVELVHSNIRFGTCFLRLRFPDGQINELNVGKLVVNFC